MSEGPPEAYKTALAMAATVFDIATSLGFHFSLLDIGGGFPVEEDKWRETSAAIKSSQEEHFSHYADLKFIAEPGVCTLSYVYIHDYYIDV